MSQGKSTGVVSSSSTPQLQAGEILPKLSSFPAKQVAEEMTLLDASLLRMIKASELENGVWMKKDKVSGGWVDG